MSGNNEKAAIWADADVFVAELGATIPADLDTPFGPEWRLVGLLDGEDGFGESRSQDRSDHVAWGNRLVRTSSRNFVLTRTFSALEENATTAGLVYPGSDDGHIRIPTRHLFLIAFVTYDGPDRTRRLITPQYAEVDEVGDITENETDLTKYEITVKIYPDKDNVLFLRQASPALSWAEESAPGVMNISSLSAVDPAAAIAAAEPDTASETAPASA